MISASGAEGISLKNTRYVHIMEPYWHPVRIQQVIGRARRICSHQGLPENRRNVKVFMYLMKFTKEQLENEASIEIKLKDVSRFDNQKPLSSDQTLYEIMNIKDTVNKQLLNAVKSASIDCEIHPRADNENYVCYNFGEPNAKEYAYVPDVTNEQSESEIKMNRQTITWKAQEITVTTNGKKMKYVLRKDTKEVYDYDSYMRVMNNGGVGYPNKIGKLVKNQGKFEIKFV